MDRLSALTTLGLAAVTACDKKPTGEPLPSRANISKVTTTNAASPASFCDKYFAGDTGPALELPPLVDGTLPASTGRWRWINVWATWCKPCVEEMPRLARWHAKLTGAGRPFDLAFISVDEDPADLAAHRKDHPDAPPSPRLADPTKQTVWYQHVGLDAAAPIPIHVFVTPSGHVRCARAAGVRETDYAAIEKLLGE